MEVKASDLHAALLSYVSILPFKYVAKGLVYLPVPLLLLITSFISCFQLTSPPRLNAWLSYAEACFLCALLIIILILWLLHRQLQSTGPGHLSHLLSCFSLIIPPFPALSSLCTWPSQRWVQHFCSSSTSVTSKSKHWLSFQPPSSTFTVLIFYNYLNDFSFSFYVLNKRTVAHLIFIQSTITACAAELTHQNVTMNPFLVPSHLGLKRKTHSKLKLVQ